MKTYNIPFNKPFIAGKELYYISQAVLSGKISGDGIFTKKCHALMEQKFKAKKILLTTSCTSALEMAAILCGIQQGDEFIAPSYTFVSTINSFVLFGAKPVFADIREDTLNIDENKIEELITPKTKCIVPVHYAGISCCMDKIMAIAKKHNLFVIEDAAQGVNAAYKDKYLGCIGELGTYSFHETKNFICGEGGAIIINDEKFIERAEIIREKGTNRTKFFKGEVDKYTWVDIGSSFLPSEVLAAFLYAQLENMDIITEKRKNIFNHYYENLYPLMEKNILQLPYIPEECQSNYHMFYIILKDVKTQEQLRKHLADKGILAIFHYVPLHNAPYSYNLGSGAQPLPVTEDLSSRLLRLPFFYDLTIGEQNVVIEEIKKFFGII